MSRIVIDWLDAWTDCETCGGSIAHGANITIDGDLKIQLPPLASCFDSWDRSDVYITILTYLGHDVEDAP